MYFDVDIPPNRCKIFRSDNASTMTQLEQQLKLQLSRISGLEFVSRSDANTDPELHIELYSWGVPDSDYCVVGSVGYVQFFGKRGYAWVSGRSSFPDIVSSAEARGNAGVRLHALLDEFIKDWALAQLPGGDR
jgi:hypothetical protein